MPFSWMYWRMTRWFAVASERAERNRSCVLRRGDGCRMRGVRGATEDEILRRILRVVAGEVHFLRAHADVDATFGFDGKTFTIHRHRAGAAGVDRAEFAAFEKKAAPGFLVILQRQRGRGRDRAAHDEAVEIGELQNDLSGDVEILDEKGVAQFSSGHARHILRPRHPADGIVDHRGQRSRRRARRSTEALCSEALRL